MAEKTSSLKVRENIKKKYLPMVAKMLTDAGEEVLYTGSNEISCPIIDELGNEQWIVVTVKVPTGTHDGEEYDGYGKEEEYRMKQEEKARKAEEAAKAKAKKIEADKRAREERKRLKELQKEQKEQKEGEKAE